jgi:hypothetical protein
MHWIGKKFCALALQTVPRVLGLCDRRPESRTYGSVDRNYWHYQLIDHSNQRYQEAGLLLALAYVFDDSDNIFFKSQRISEWSRQVWRFWLKNRNRDGSSSETYPFERSFCATAFTTAAFLETVDLLGGVEEWTSELDAVQPTVYWLAKKRNEEVANQMCASLWALAAYAHLMSDLEIRKAAVERTNQIIELSEKKGVLLEYGGFDLGYQSISLSAMVRAQTFGLNEPVFVDLIARAQSVMERYMDPEGKTKPSGNSRGTEYIFPYGLTVRESRIIKQIEAGFKRDTVLNPTWMDDRYCIAFASDYLMAGREILLR